MSTPSPSPESPATFEEVVDDVSTFLATAQRLAELATNENIANGLKGGIDYPVPDGFILLAFGKKDPLSAFTHKDGQYTHDLGKTFTEEQPLRVRHLGLSIFESGSCMLYLDTSSDRYGYSLKASMWGHQIGNIAVRPRAVARPF